MSDEPVNFRADPIEVRHADLKKVNEESPYRVVCPVCEDGVLLVARNNQTFKLMRRDRCVVCAQTIVYTDDTINGETLEE